MKWIAALAVAVPMLMAQGGETLSVTGVRHFDHGDSLRVAVEVSGDFESRSDRLHNPERIYFDVLGARPRIAGRRIYSETLDGPLVKRIRVAETQPGVTRIVLELGDSAEAEASHLRNPHRLIVEVRRTGAPAAVPTGAPATPATPLIRQEPPRLVTPPPSVKPPVKAALPDNMTAEPSHSQMAKTGSTPAGAGPAPAALTSASKRTVDAPASAPPAADPAPSKAVSAKPGDASAASGGAPAAAPKSASSTAEAAAPKPVPAKSAGPTSSAAEEVGRAARHTTAGETSLVRALGLKINRVVIDPGHGGHDQGTQGPRGLLEKDLVLDVARRVGKLVEDKMGAEAIFTRTDDTFVPLEGRTELANEKKADLFLSIHANSSPLPRTAGVETYFLNVRGSSRDALDVASRENSSSQKSVFELADIIQRITKQEKAEESREFAGRIQTSLFAFSQRNVPGARNRGVRTAPFVVLIGAHMPSVLAEIGFLSNAREESLLKKPDYRQKLAEALFRGLTRYADGLSHFQMAQAAATKP
jgi:N-acetylmuramoyl-L-alanine amidase